LDQKGRNMFNLQVWHINLTEKNLFYLKRHITAKLQQKSNIA